jgi:catechol 2,3-dioxygenase-like lactoylglutathione lyase family enzyme
MFRMMAIGDTIRSSRGARAFARLSAGCASKLGAGMKPRITVVTLGVDDLERALAFYRDGLGLPTRGIIGTEFEHGAVAFFELGGGLILALYPRASLAHEARVAVGAPSAAEFTVGHNVGSKAEVDAVMAQAAAAGATITDPARERFWGGYGGHFQDPDGHVWEIVWNPAWELPE